MLNQFSQLKYALGLGGMMSFYGAVTLVILLLPPGTFGGRQYQIVVIALILITLPFSLLLMFVASRRAKKKAKKALEEKEAAAGEATPADAAPKIAAAPAGNYTELGSGTEETVQFLKTSNLGAGGKEAVYSLPWYMVAGAPKSGKSSLVISSNLNFQTLPSQRQSEQKFIQPTRNIDWRVTSDAVFLDTAGRYQTEGVDGDEWASLLENIKKYRGNRPLDGFLLVVNSETILKGEEREIEELAKVLRARLDDALLRLKVRFPVYVVFTHADTIEGFRDSFSSSKNEDKTLVWGSTIPLDKSENAQSLFDSEFETLHSSLMKRRLIRLSAPFPPVRQLRIFNFPLHFGSARRKFGSFINALFRPNPFAESPFLRGFYFTASPIAKSTGNAPQTVGNSYFTERFFRDVLLRDKDLVRTFQAQKQRAPIFGWLLTFFGAVVVFLLLALSGFSLYKNHELLQRAESTGLKLITLARESKGVSPLTKKDQAVRDELNITEESRGLLSELDDYNRNGAPWSMRFGLYSGDQIYKERLLPNYMNVVEARFKDGAIRKLEADLKKFSTSQPVANPAKLTEPEEKALAGNLDLLKAYLMLTGGEYKEKVQPEVIVNALKSGWLSESKTPTDMQNVALRQLEFWAKQADRSDAEYTFPYIKFDKDLVSAVRSKLLAYPAEYRYLSRRVGEISKELDDAGLGPMTVSDILSRKNATSQYIVGNFPVPSAYSRDGNAKMLAAIDEANEKLSEDDWVMGGDSKAGSARNVNTADLRTRYYQDYTDNWRNFVKGIDVKPYKDLNDANSAFQQFASDTSPIDVLLKEVVRNTQLSAKDENQGWWPWIKSFLPGSGKGTTTVTPPEEEFKPLVDFVAKKENPAIANYRRELSGLSTAIAKNPDIRKVASDMNAEKDPLGLKTSRNKIVSLTQPLSGKQAGTEIAAFLMKPVQNLEVLLGVSGLEALKKTWTDQLLPASREIEKGYPFGDGPDDDMSLITDFLAPGEGKFSDFFDKKASKCFDEAAGQYKLKPGPECTYTDEFVVYINTALGLRNALFGKDPKPKFEYEFTIQPSKDSKVEITIDGQKASSDGASVIGSFPASGGDAGVVISVDSSGGTASTAPAPTTPAANSNSNSAASTKPAAEPGNGRYPGTWGLFKFVDAGNPEKQAGGEYLLKYNIGGKTITATIKPRGGDLFDKTIFKQFRAPQNLVK